MPQGIQDLGSAEEARGAPGPPKAQALINTLQNEAWKEKQFSDITIDVRGRHFALHRLVVCESPLFKSLFRGQWKEAQKLYTLPVEDKYVTAAVFEAVVASMYGKDLDLTPENAKGVYATTSFLQLSNLSLQCVQYIVAHLTVQNVGDYLHFAVMNKYLNSKVLVGGCTAYYTQYVQELRNQLADVPLGVLQDILKSDALAVPTEVHRFRLVLEVFKDKMEAVWTNLDVGSDDDSEHFVLKVDGDEDEFHDCQASSETYFTPRQAPQQTPRQAPGRALRRGHIADVPFDFSFRHEELAEIREAFKDVLEKGVLYEHLRDREVMEVSSTLERLGIAEGVHAFHRGMLNARMLRMAIQGVQNEELRCSASAMCQAKGTPAFRFCCELDDVLKAGLFGRWESEKHFYGGSCWWIKVEGRKEVGGDSLGVRLCCASAVKVDGEYVNKLTPQVCVTLRCGEICKTIEKDGARWLAHTDFVLHASKIERCMTQLGSIRFVVLIKLVLGTQWL